MKKEMALYCVFLTGIVVCGVSLWCLHYSIQVIDVNGTPKMAPAEGEALVGKVLEKIEKGELPMEDIKEILLLSQGIIETEYKGIQSIKQVQIGLKGMVEGVCILYLLALSIYFYVRKT